MSKASLDGPVSVIMIISLIILGTSFIYPLFKSIFSFSAIYKLSFFILVLLSIMAIAKETEIKSVL